MEADWRVLVSVSGGGWRDVFGEVLFDNVWVPEAIFVTQSQTQRHGHNHITMPPNVSRVPSTATIVRVEKLADSQLFWSNWKRENPRVYFIY